MTNLSIPSGAPLLLAPSHQGVIAQRAALPLGPPNARAGGWQVISQGLEITFWSHLQGGRGCDSESRCSGRSRHLGQGARVVGVVAAEDGEFEGNALQGDDLFQRCGERVVQVRGDVEGGLLCVTEDDERCLGLGNLVDESVD